MRFPRDGHAEIVICRGLKCHTQESVNLMQWAVLGSDQCHDSDLPKYEVSHF